jgi:pyruvate formate lyase activating enzyme
MQLTDTVLLDIKHIDDEKHRWLTGHTNSNILDCARYLSDIQKPVWLRHVLAPGVTDDEPSLIQLCQFISSLKNIERVEVLPYHTLGVYKWQKLGIEYTLKDIPQATKEDVERAEKILLGELIK